MEILISLTLLTLISCGGGTGSGLGASNLATPGNPITYPQGSGYETLDKFKSSVANNQWAQNPSFRNYNNFKFNYRDAKSTSGCSKIGSGIFSFSYCLNQGTATPVWVTTEQKGVISNPLVSLAVIRDVVNRAVAYVPYTTIVPTTPYAYFDGQQWVIILGTETYAFNMAYPLGANPTFYKNSAGKEFSLANYEYSFIQ